MSEEAHKPIPPIMSIESLLDFGFKEYPKNQHNN